MDPDFFPEILTLVDVAAFLRCSKAHVAKIVRGEVAGIKPLPRVSLGRRKLIRRESLIRWLSEAEDDATMAASQKTGAGGRA
jgi:hypothetical protein